MSDIEDVLERIDFLHYQMRLKTLDVSSRIELPRIMAQYEQNLYRLASLGAYRELDKETSWYVGFMEREKLERNNIDTLLSRGFNETAYIPLGVSLDDKKKI